MGHSVLLVDDEESVRTSIELYLLEKDYTVYTASTVAEGVEKLDRYLPDVLLVDLKMPDKDGFHLIREAQRRNSAAGIIVISGHGDIEKAVRATKMGVYKFIEKPFSLAEIEHAIQQTMSAESWHHHLLRVDKDGIRMEAPGWTLLGISDAMKDIYRKIQMVSRSSQSTVLIQGESGTGKELVARAVFENCHKPKGKFVDVNCAALSESLLEAELFGHQKGAFTGATETRKGLFEAADQGAIFLDEIGDMPLKLQAKLLRVLEEKSFKRVGGTENIHVTCRIIASTNRNLWETVSKGQFRRDLFYRLDVFTIHIPPLRERPADIPVLSSYFLKQLSKSCNKRFSGFSAEAMQRLTQYDWPGNVRELRNVVERAVILGSGGMVQLEQLVISPSMRAESPSSRQFAAPIESLETMEKRLIRHVLEQNNWHKARTAQVLGINRTTLWQKIKRYGLQPEGRAA